MPDAPNVWTVVFITASSVACNYATRSLMPIASHAICHEDAECSAAHLISESTEAFFVGDLVAQFGAGMLVRCLSGPRLLAISTTGWAASTLLIPAVLHHARHRYVPGLLHFARGVLCGVGFPAAHAVVASTPSEIRATALGLINASAGLGAMLANVVIPKLLREHHWALPFYLLGAVSLLVAASLGNFAAKQGRGPLSHDQARPSVDETLAGVRHAAAEYTRWLEQPLVQALVIWMVVVAVGVQTLGSAFLPTLFIERHGVGVADLAVYTGTPPLAQVAVALGGGLLCDVLVSKVGLPASQVQARLQLVAVVFPALSLLALGSVDGCPSTAGVLAVVWLGCTSFHSAGAFVVLHAVGRQRAGELFVLGNAFAKLGALLSTSAAEWALTALGWQAVLTGLAAAYAASGMLLLPRMSQVEEAATFVAAGAHLHQKAD